MSAPIGWGFVTGHDGALLDGDLASVNHSNITTPAQFGYFVLDNIILRTSLCNFQYPPIWV